MSPKEMTELIKILKGHDKLINLLAQSSADLSCLSLVQLDKCTRLHCTSSATVKHSVLGIIMCDRHAAETIVKSGRLFNTDENDSLNPVRATLLREEDWEDLEDAERIRRTEDYVAIIKDGFKDQLKH